MTTEANGTSVTGTAVREIAELADRAAGPKIVDIGEYTFADRTLTRVDEDPRGPKTLEFYTLAAFASYLIAENESQRPLVHVATPTLVEAVSKLFGDDDHLRRTPARAVCKSAVLSGFSFNSPVPLETLTIALQTCFEPGRGLIDVLRKFCMGVKDTQEVRLADDGVSQEVNAKRGIAAVQATPVVNPWGLAPWRTFAEVEQPVSPYVLRFMQGEEPRAGLFETGDARWQVEAVKSIAAKLRELLGDGWTVLG